MNAIGEKIKFETITKGCREFDAKETMLLLRHNLAIFWCWGAHAFTVDKQRGTRMLRMTVSGRLHKGHVYIFLNGIDLFNVYLTSSQGTIKKISEDLYFDMLTNWIDTNIEKIPAYSF